jgi:hypothetical protein
MVRLPSEGDVRCFDFHLLIHFSLSRHCLGIDVEFDRGKGLKEGLNDPSVNRSRGDVLTYTCNV